jgi:hypothetical protein
MDSRKIRGIEDAVDRSFSLLDGDEYAFLAHARDVILSRRALFFGIAERIRRGMEDRDPGRRIDPWASLAVTETPEVFPRDSRHRATRLHEGASRLSVGIVHGSFDPFHLGHLLMGLGAVADGTCDFVIFAPNADRASGGSSEKPGKSAFDWRARTAFEGGVDDFYPAARLSSFGSSGDAVAVYSRLMGANRKAFESLDELTIHSIIGSDIVFRPRFAEWTNDRYGRIRELLGPRARLRFRIVERSGFSDCSARARTIDFPVEVVPEISCASSSAIRLDPVSSVWLYPRAVPLLESYLLYGHARR